MLDRISSEPFYVTLSFLEYWGMWTKDRSKKAIRGMYLKSFFMRLFAFSILSPIIPHLFISTINNIDVDISEDVSNTAVLFHFLATTIIFILSTRKWADLFEKVNDFSKFKKSSNFKQLNRKLNIYSIIYIIYSLGGVIVFALIAKYNKGKCLNNNEKRGLHEQCGFFFTVWFPITIKYPWNEIFFLLQAFACVINAPTVAIIFTIPFQVTMNIVIKIDDLKQCLIHLYDEPDAAIRRKKFEYCVQYHQFILSLSKDLDTCGKVLCSVFAIVAALIFGCIGNHFVQEKSLNSLVLLVGYITAVFFLCNAGQKLSDGNSSLADAVKHAKFYKVDDKPLNKDIIFVIMRAQRSFYLNASILGVFNYPLFVAILKTSYSYLTLLNNVV